MADIQDVGDRGIDISRGVRAGIDIVGGVERIKQGREQEARAEESFALDKKVTEQGLEIQKQQEVDRRKNKRIDTIERGIETAFKYKNFKATDELRQEWEIETGYHFGGDNEELATLLSDRRKAVNANDADEVAAIDSYLNDVRQVSPEEAAGTLGLTSEVEELGAERKFERGVKEEKQVFDIKTERKETERKETAERVTKSLESIEGLDETTKALLPLISSGDISGAALNVLAAQSGVTFQGGKAGTGVNKGKSVTFMFDKEGNKVQEIVEADTKQTKERVITTPGLFPGDPPTVQVLVRSEDVNGNPDFTIHTAKVKEATPEAKAVGVEQEQTDLIEKLKGLGSAGDLTPEAFLGSIDNPEEVSEEEILEAYKEALEVRGAIEEQKKVRSKKKGRGFLRKLLKLDDVKGTGIPFQSAPDEEDET